jgi:anti-anti-sigma factor
MKLAVLSDDGRVVRLACQGEVVRGAASTRESLEQLLGPGCFARTVLLSLQQATVIDSSGIGWLIIAHRQFQTEGGWLILHDVPAAIASVLQFMRLHAFVTIADDEAAARALALGGGSGGTPPRRGRGGGRSRPPRRPDDP